MTEAEVGPNLENHFSFCIIDRFWGGSFHLQPRKDGKRYDFDTVAYSELDTMYTLHIIMYLMIYNTPLTTK